MTHRIHPTAIIHPTAELAADVVVEPFALIGPQVVIGAGSRVGSRATLERNARIGEGVVVGSGSIVGGDPQDLKYRGEETWVEIGDGTVIREYVTINRGTAATGVTRVGRKAFLMSYVHLAHDCRVGDGVIIANATQIAGHVTIHEGAIISGLCAIHQFVSIGSLAFIGGLSRVNQDIPPFVKANGNPLELFGLNSIGLRRAGFGPDTIGALKRAYRLFFNSELTITQALERVREDCPGVGEVDRLVEFVTHSQRGVPA